MKQKKTINQFVASFANHLGAGIQSIYLAAKEYADAVVEYPDKASEEFHKAFPQVTEATWDKMRLVGSGSAVPAIMLVSDRLAFKIARMPIDKQKSIFGTDAPLRIVNRTTGKVERVRIADITARQERILFDDEKNEVRSVAQQKKFVETLNDGDAKESLPPYEVQGNVLFVRRRCNIGREELVRIIGSMR